MSGRSIRPVCLGALMIASLWLAVGTSAASAHVELEPSTAKAGGTATLVFSPLNEEKDAGTIKVEVLFPRSFPIVSAVPQTGNAWTVDVTTRTVRKPVSGPDGKKTRSVVDKVTWIGGPSATSGSFALRGLTVGKLPTKAKQLEFKVIQTYANGHVDRWYQKTVPGTPEPEAPAPVLRLTKAGAAE